MEWDGKTYVSVTLDSSWYGEVCGMCANYDGLTDNELKNRNNLSVDNINTFGRRTIFF